MTPRGDRAATLTEYALIVGLVVVVTIGAVTRLQSDGQSNLVADGGRIGSSSDNAYYAGAATTTTSPPGTTTTTAATTAVRPSSLAPSPPSSDAPANKWTANATVTIVNSATNAPVSGILVQGTWNPPNNPVVNVSCTTVAPSGTCPVQRNSINDNDPTATFTITSITGSGYSWTPSGGDATTVVVNCPGSPATCD